MVIVFDSDMGDYGSIPSRDITKTQETGTGMPPYLTHCFIRYRSRVSGAILS